MNELVENIRNQTSVLFVNADIMLRSCDLNLDLCGMPLWKHAYHMLHSCDQWYISPFEYDKEPEFHEPDLNSLDIPSTKTLSLEVLSAYLEAVREKIMTYFDGLTDEMLYEIPTGCTSNRLGLILSQYRHFYTHLGIINSVTMAKTGKWPRVVGYNGKERKTVTHLFE